MYLLLMVLICTKPSMEWPRMAVAQPYADFLGWSSDTAWVHETIIHDLTWFGGECAPIFHLPVLDSALLSPDSSLLFFSILYGPCMEYFVTHSGI